jgi:hypothetical protein
VSLAIGPGRRFPFTLLPQFEPLPFLVARELVAGSRIAMIPAGTPAFGPRFRLGARKRLGRFFWRREQLIALEPPEHRFRVTSLELPQRGHERVGIAAAKRGRVGADQNRPEPRSGHRPSQHSDQNFTF